MKYEPSKKKRSCEIGLALLNEFMNLWMTGNDIIELVWVIVWIQKLYDNKNKIK